ncbi:MAG: putative porin [Myxococcota bacterium]|nr:putative porin [Myxococcota bacterium]
MGKAFIIVFFAVVLAPFMARAQGSEGTDPEALTEGTPKGAPEHNWAAQFQQELAAQEARFKQELELQKAEIEQLKADIASKGEFEENASAHGEDVEERNRFLSIYGFYDLTLNKWIYDNGEAYALFSHDSLSFVISNLNIYFHSQISRSLTFLSEIKFSFLPFGQEYSFEGVVNGNKTGVQYGSVGGKEGHFYRDPVTSNQYYTGGIYIERVYLDYSPFDWLKIKAGRFLTPYGIWNIEHGTPIVTMVRVPYMQSRDMMPLNQTGLEIYGRFYPSYELFLDYSITVSNGRERFSFYDLDDKKAFGARLHLSYEGNKATISGGGYVYYGNYTKIKKRALIDTTKNTLRVDKVEEGSRNELVISGDLLFEYLGARLQGEFIWRRDEVEVPRPLTYEDQLLLAHDLTGEMTGDFVYFDPSNTGYDFYVLFAYTLPLQRWLGQFLIKPYFCYELSRYMDTKPILNLSNFVFGINLQPHPNVVVKLEATHSRAETDDFGDPFWNAAAQLAVSF